MSKRTLLLMILLLVTGQACMLAGTPLQSSVRVSSVEVAPASGAAQDSFTVTVTYVVGEVSGVIECYLDGTPVHSIPMFTTTMRSSNDIGRDSFTVQSDKPGEHTVSCKSPETAVKADTFTINEAVNDIRVLEASGTRTQHIYIGSNITILCEAPVQITLAIQPDGKALLNSIGPWFKSDYGKCGQDSNNMFLSEGIADQSGMVTFATSNIDGGKTTGTLQINGETLTGTVTDTNSFGGTWIVVKIGP